jgi:aspartate/methionine/tyrosine aminotransferase
MPNPLVTATVTSPITEAYSWIANREFPASRPLIDVSQAVPGYPPPAELTDHLASIISDPRLARYGPVLGMPELRAAFAADMSRAYAADIPESHAAITAGCNQSFALIATALCERGDELIVPVPFYFNHDMWLGMNGITARYLPCDDSMLPEVDQADSLITERTRAILLVTPNNPTGRVYPPQLIADFAALARRRGIHLVLDETYRDFRPDTSPAHGLFSDPDWADSVVHLHSFSKVFSITGYRVGGLVASPELLTEVDKIADCLTICPSRIGQAAVSYGLEHLGSWVDSNRILMNRRVDTFREAMAEAAVDAEIAAAGAYFAWLRHPMEAAGSEVANRLVDEQNVLGLAGSMFGPGPANSLRLAFANLEEEAMPTLAGRLADFFG